MKNKVRRASIMIGNTLAQGRDASLAFAQDVLEAVAHEFGLSVTDILAASRNHQVWKPRIAAMYCARRLTRCTLPELGKLFGGRSHTTVMRAIEHCHRLIETDREWAQRVEKVFISLGARRMALPT